MALVDISTRSRWALAIAAILFIGYLFFIPYFLELVYIGAGYKAKTLCSAIFVSKRNETDVLTTDLAAEDLKKFKLFSSEIDRQANTVSAYLFSGFHRVAAYRPGLGCTLLNDIDPKKFQERTPAIQTIKPLAESDPWPLGASPVIQSPPSHVKVDALNDAIDWAFTEKDFDKQKRTRAVVVVYQGKLIAERYAEGFNGQTPLISWSMTKSMTNALVGILVKAGKLNLYDENFYIHWQDDTRVEITLDDLLKMHSGLLFEEDYSEAITDVSKMLYLYPEAAHYAASKPLKVKSGTQWHYSSGNSNIINWIIRETFSGNLDEYLNFPYKTLFEPLGMANTVLETDVGNTFIGSSYAYATARDWARFGLLYLQDGLWNEQRILPEGWVKYSTTPNGSDPHNRYAAHFWLKVSDAYKSAQRPAIKLPDDIFFAVGYEGQFLTIIPSKALVIVRMGLTREAGVWDQEMFIDNVLKAFPKQ